MSKRIVLFNHKGGVSKTTTSYNLGWMLGLIGKRVLLVDADPQCNLSALILGDSFEEYYTNPNTSTQNLKDGVKVAFEGKPHPISAVTCVNVEQNKNLWLLPGHANLSEYDPALSFAQTSNNALSALQNLPGSFNELLKLTEEVYKVDYTIIDLNPGLSAINQNMFILSNYFVIPTNPDPFSIMAVSTLVNVLPRWVDWLNNMSSAFADATYPLPKTTPILIGTIIQRFNIRNGKAARPYRDNIEEIKQTITDRLYPTLLSKKMAVDKTIYLKAGIDNGYCLIEVPDFQGLLPKAHENGVPVFALTDAQIHESGTVLEGMQTKRKKFYDDFNSLAQKIISFDNYVDELPQV